MPCIRCNTKVASGGDRHAKGACPIRGRRGEHHMAKMRTKRRAKRAADFHVVRGSAVAGTGKPSASSGETKKKARV